jgi:DNA helicase-2/ATP-dependent DNA helicase PcrA
VVGDDAQSIYSFRAATVRNILDFPHGFPGTTVLTLTQNYRSHQPLLSATNAVIGQATERYEKHLWSPRAEGGPPTLVTCTDEQEQTEYVVERILEHREAGVPLRHQAVLFRASHHSLDLELELSRRNIPYHKYGGLKFLEAAHVKDLLAFLRFAENPRDVSAGLRMLQLLPGIGPKRAGELLDEVARAGGNAAGAWAQAAVPPALSQTWPRLVEMLGTLTAAEPPPVPAQLHLVRTFYGPLLERAHDNPLARMQDLEQIEQLATRYRDRGTFLAELTLDPPSWTGDLAGPPVLDEDYLILSTMHSAKGLEWDAVYVIHAADGNIPSDMSTGSEDEIEEERRLFYVALTRAKDWLYVTVPLQYYKRPRDQFDRYGYAQPTRFISDDVKPFFVYTSAGPDRPANDDGPAAAGCGPGPTTAERIRAGVQSLWD